MEPHFDRKASEYEGRMGGITKAVARIIAVILMDYGIFSKDSVVLDNACGTGIQTLELLELAKQSEKEHPSPRIFAVDVAQEMLDLMKIPTERKHDVQKIRMPGEHLIFKDNFFTHSITTSSLFLFQDPAAGASEINRTLKPGCHALVSTWRKPEHLTEAFVLIADMRGQDGTPNGVVIDEMWWDPSYVRCVLEHAGLNVLKQEEKTVMYSAKDMETLVCNQAQMAIFMMGKDPPKDKVERLKQAVGEKVRMMATSTDGGMGVEYTAVIAICSKSLTQE